MQTKFYFCKQLDSKVLMKMLMNQCEFVWSTILLMSSQINVKMIFNYNSSRNDFYCKNFWNDYNAIFSIHSKISKLAVFCYYGTRNWTLKKYVVGLKTHVFTLNVHSGVNSINIWWVFFHQCTLIFYDEFIKMNSINFLREFWIMKTNSIKYCVRV